MQPTGDQLTAFDDLNTAAAKANDVVKSSCPTAMPLTPAARLDAAQARLEAMMKAVDIVRGPLQMFYDSLSDEQRQRFDAMGNTGNGHNYYVRQSFIFEGKYVDNTAVFHQIKSHEAYQALPRKVSNQMLIQLHKAWVSFFEAMEAWREHPEQFTSRPKLPGYKHSPAGRNLLVYELGAVWKRDLGRGLIAVSGLGS